MWMAQWDLIHFTYKRAILLWIKVTPSVGSSLQNNKSEFKGLRGTKNLFGAQPTTKRSRKTIEMHFGYRSCYLDAI